MKQKLNSKGFTLIELLLVISIIGLLSSIILVSVNTVREKARDAVRKSTLNQVAKAMELYYADHGTYAIPNSGWGSSTGSGCSCGWFSYEGGWYGRSIARALKEEGYLGEIVVDPSGGVTGAQSYMKYQRGSGFFIYVGLENPSPADLATCNTDSQCPGYGMNYAIGHR